MELALNLAWVCLALSGVALLASELSCCPRHDPQRPSNQQKIIAMGCALIILFFVVSMTDDLHDQEVVVEESRMLRVIGAAGWHSPTSAHSWKADEFQQSFAITSSSFVFALTAAGRLAEPRETLFAAADFSNSPRGRAPPAVLA